MKEILGKFAMQKFGLGLALALPAAALAPTALFAQAAPAVVPVKVHGKVTNAAGIPFKGGQVKLGSSNDKETDPAKKKWLYTFPIDDNGGFKGDGIAPGAYLMVVTADNKLVDFQQVNFKSGEDRTVDFDMTRAEYIKGMSAEDKAALEEFKKKNSAITADNAKIANINAVLTQARADEKAGKADDAVTALKGLTAQKADEPLLWASLGEAQLAQADANAKTAKAAGKSPTDPAIQQNYADAATSYQKAIELNTSSKKPSPELASSAYQNLGQAYAKAGKTTEAAAAYEGAVKASPASASGAYYNEAAIFYNAGKLDDAAAAADKAIAADPKRAEAYYIKGQALIPKATVDPKTQKIVAPPGCVEAYQQYLELAPDGPHAADVKGILTGIGATISNTYKAPGKKK